MPKKAKTGSSIGNVIRNVMSGSGQQNNFNGVVWGDGNAVRNNRFSSGVFAFGNNSVACNNMVTLTSGRKRDRLEVTTDDDADAMNEVVIKINGEEVKLPENIKSLLVTTKGKVEMQIEVKATHLKSASTTSGDLYVSGEVGTARTTSGDIQCGNIAHGASTTSGDIHCESVDSASTVSGDVSTSGRKRKNYSKYGSAGDGSVTFQ